MGKTFLKFLAVKFLEARELIKDLYKVFLELKTDLLESLIGKLAIIIISIPLTHYVDVVIKFISKYVYADFDYLIFLIVILIADGISKTVSLWEEDKTKVSFKLFIHGIGEKFVKYMSYLIALHVLIYFTIENKQNEIYALSGLKTYFFGALIALEFTSVVKNSGIDVPEIVQNLIDKWKPKKTE